MNTRRILPIILIVLAVIMAFSMCGSYNTAVQKDENVKRAWSDVQNVYQRRADLIPNLVETVKGYAKHEQGTLTAVMEARAQATRVNISAENLTPEALAQFQQAQAGLQGAFSRLMAVAEAYPDLKANQNFIDLQKQLEGSENRIATERRKYNEAVQDYNTYIRRFPTNLLVGIAGFQQRPTFEAQPGAEQAPRVQF